MKNIKQSMIITSFEVIVFTLIICVKQFLLTGMTYFIDTLLLHFFTSCNRKYYQLTLLQYPAYILYNINIVNFVVLTCLLLFKLIFVYHIYIIQH